MTALRELRHATGLGQREFAALLAVPLQTFRTWDSGRRPVPVAIFQRATDAVARRQQELEPLPLAQLARELQIHIRTLQAAARTGRLATQFAVRSVFGRPMRYATRAAGAQFLATHYRRFTGQQPCPAPLPTVPADYDHYLRQLRRRRHFTQAALADRIGAAGKVTCLAFFGPAEA